MLFFLSFCQNKQSEGVEELSEQKYQHEKPSQVQVVFYSLEEFFNNTSDGDIILKMGKGPISKIATEKLKENIPISHCGIVYKKDTSYIIHSLSNLYGDVDGVQGISFEDFYNDTRENALFVLRFKDEKKRKQLSSKAAFYQNLNVPFDYDFDIEDTTSMFCSEFVAHTMESTLGKVYFGINNKSNKPLYNFNDLLFSDDFILVNTK